MFPQCVNKRQHSKIHIMIWCTKLHKKRFRKFSYLNHQDLLAKFSTDDEDMENCISSVEGDLFIIKSQYYIRESSFF